MTWYSTVDPTDWREGQVIELDNAPETIIGWRTGDRDEPQQLATMRLQLYDDMPPIWWVRIYRWHRHAMALELVVEDELGMHVPWVR